MEPTQQTGGGMGNSAGGKSNAKMWGVGALAVLVLVAVTLALTGKKPTVETVTDNPVTTPVDTTTPTPNTPDVTTTPADKKSVYKNGTYTSEGDYVSPGGSESIKVTVTLKDDIVTDATVVAQATTPISAQMQAQFISGFKQFVIGKNIADVRLTKVSGSSLTPKGWNDAVAKIEAQAKA